MAVSLRHTENAQPMLAILAGVPVFDIAHFERQTFGDASLQREIIELYLVQLGEARKSLAVPMTSTSWRFLTHTLKGASAAVGAGRIAEIAAHWELAGTPQDAEARSVLLDILDEELQDFVSAASAFQV